ncbi:hypothetical protein FGG79_03040 [Bacillus sp. BHET2]|uniref:hypothetical protein n=1 Tax=Bacillus sp. BHET2 TaxID=2583818 RepID=UPI00110E4F9E|nr:hypothetical protein [Bacillus sp. BHET2]TMU87130.1 hypothetical protein FGG79_03040 [Bacillus sp. BHET2]
MKKLIVILLCCTLPFLLLGCADEETVEEISNNELIVKHWSKLGQDRKTNIVKEIFEEERINMSNENYQDNKSSIISLFDKALEKTPYQENNLKKSMKEFYKDRKITEEAN